MKDNQMEFERVYQEYVNQLYRIATSYTSDEYIAQDIVQEVFIKYLKTNKKFLDEKHEQAWFIRVTINLCHDYFRSNKHFILSDELEHASKHTEFSDVFHYLSLLPEKNRSVIILHYLEGYSMKEIASMLRCSISTVKMRILRGKQMLKAKMREDSDV